MVRVTLSNAFDLERLTAGEEVLPRAMEVMRRPIPVPFAR